MSRWHVEPGRRARWGCQRQAVWDGLRRFGCVGVQQLPRRRGLTAPTIAAGIASNPAPCHADRAATVYELQDSYRTADGLEYLLRWAACMLVLWCKLQVVCDQHHQRLLSTACVLTHDT